MNASQGWPAPAKINLFLHITGQRADGYHLLQTLFQFLDIGDELEFEVRADGGINRMTDLTGVEASADLVVNAAQLLQRVSGTSLGVDIAVRKRLPMGAGLGGGSSDAATVLVALNTLWSLGLGPARLAEIGLELGADVPVFVHGQAAWAEGVGEILKPAEIEQSPVVVVTPACHVDTARVFRDADLTRNTPPITMHAASLNRAGNDCEPVTRRLYPEVGEALEWLSQFAEARMSGTGSSVFAFFDNMGEAEEVARQAPQAWTCMTTRRSNRSPLLDFVDSRGAS